MKKLMAGAAIRSIDPTPEMIHALNTDPNTRYAYEGIGDPMFCRVTILSDGEEHFCILASDLSQCILTVEFLEELERRYGIDSCHVIGGGTRSHQTVSYQFGDHYGNYPPGAAAYYRYFHSVLLDAVGEALSNLRPARIGAAVGESRINVSREFPSPIGTLETQNHNAPEAPWLRVVKVESTDGEIISVLVNYSMHCCLLCWNDIIGEYKYTSGDVAGAVSQYVERYGKHKYPVSWIVGGGTDREPTIYSLLEHCAVDDNGNFYFKRNVMPIAAVRMLLEQYAAEQGLDVIRTMESISDMSEEFDFFLAQTTREVPAKKSLEARFRSLVTDDHVARYIPGMDTTPEPVDPPLLFRYRLAVLNGIAFAGINGAPYAALYKQMADQMPAKVTMMFDDCFGSISNIPTADAEEKGIYGHSTFQSKQLSARQGAETFLEAFRQLGQEYLNSKRR